MIKLKKPVGTDRFLAGVLIGVLIAVSIAVGVYLAWAVAIGAGWIAHIAGTGPCG